MRHPLLPGDARRSGPSVVGVGVWVGCEGLGCPGGRGGKGGRERQRSTYLLILVELRQLPRPDLVGIHAGAVVDGCRW